MQSGYHAQFMQVYNPSRAPAPPGKEDLYSKPNTEPFYVTTFAWKETDKQLKQDPEANLGYQYFISWYIGQISDDAVRPSRRYLILPLSIIKSRCRKRGLGYLWMRQTTRVNCWPMMRPWDGSVAQKKMCCGLRGRSSYKRWRLRLLLLTSLESADHFKARHKMCTNVAICSGCVLELRHGTTALLVSHQFLCLISADSHGRWFIRSGRWNDGQEP